MKMKTFTAPIELKADGEGEPGEFTAVFSRFNVIDHDGDVTLPGAFAEGQAVRIAYWGHRWQDLPVGRGVIHQDEEKAWVDGRFFLQTQVGKETYETVKALGELQEWSYGFDVDEAEPGVFAGENVTFLRRLNVHEVSPVLLGAGIGTGTTDIKDRAGSQSRSMADDGKDEAGGEPTKTRPHCGVSREAGGTGKSELMTLINIGEATVIRLRTNGA